MQRTPPPPCPGVPDPAAPEWCAVCPSPMKHPRHAQTRAVPVTPAAPHVQSAWDAEDLRAGLEARDEGQQVALINTPVEWRAAAVRAVKRLADSGKKFTSEDVTAIVGLPSGGVATNANNGLGSLMTGAARRGVIVKLSERVPANREESHSREIAVWVGRDFAHLYENQDQHRGETA